jgi:hypothetical protein
MNISDVPFSVRNKLVLPIDYAYLMEIKFTRPEEQP